MKCFINEEPKEDVFFAVYSDLSGATFFYKDDTGIFIDPINDREIDDVNWFLDAGYLWFFEVDEDLLKWQKVLIIKQILKMTLEQIEQIANVVLKSAGSGLCHYTPYSRERILKDLEEHLAATGRLNVLAEPVNKGEISDGYHTFNELYEHRHALFAALSSFTDSWKSKLHSDGTMFDGWFIAGINTPAGQATYHLPISWWDFFPSKELEQAPEWDGHTSNDVVSRLKIVRSKNYQVAEPDQDVRPAVTEWQPIKTAPRDNTNMTDTTENMPERIWCVDGGETDHPEFMHGTYTNSKTYGVGVKTEYIRRDVAYPVTKEAARNILYKAKNFGDGGDLIDFWCDHEREIIALLEAASK